MSLNPELPFINDTQIIPGEQLQDIEELDFEQILLGDSILLSFSDGRAYALTICEQDEDGNLFAKLSVGKKTQLAEEIQTWNDIPHRIRLKGSCAGLQTVNGETSVIDGEYGSFWIGKKAWMEFTTGNGDKQMVSNDIQRITHISSREE